MIARAFSAEFGIIILNLRPLLWTKLQKPPGTMMLSTNFQTAPVSFHHYQMGNFRLQLGWKSQIDF